jgi:extracellular elastinolytic metalloproteinase
VIDYVSHAAYKVIPHTKKDPRDGFEILVDPAYKESSPGGWHSDGTKTFKTTIGNNVESRAIERFRRIYVESEDLKFTPDFNPLQPPKSPTNRNASMVNLFYCKSMGIQ